jgi:zinc protease
VGVFSITTDLHPERLDAALQGVAGQVAALADGGPAPVELERATTLLTAQWARRLESVEGRASAFAAAEALGGVDILEREYQALLAVTPDAVRDVVQRYLRPDAVSSVAYVPERSSADLTGERLASVFRDARPAPAPQEPPPAPMPRRSPAPGGDRARVAGVEIVRLPGVDLLLRRKAGVPLVSVGIYRTRSTVERIDTAGVGALAVRAAVRGAGGLSAGALADRFERMGGTLGASIAADWFGISTSVLARFAGDALQLIDLVLREPAFAADEVERERQTLAQDVIHGTDDMFRYPVELALAAGFGERRYGIPVKGVPGSVERLTPELVRAWHRDEARTGRATVMAVGDIDAEQLIPTLNALFADRDDGHHAANAVRSERIDPGVRAERRRKSQTALAMLFPGPTRRDPDRHTAMVLAAVASGLGGRLFHALRDRRSLGYTVLVSSWQRRAGGGLLTYIATSPDREQEAREAMLEELGKLGTEGVSAEELSQAISYLVGQTAVQRQTASAVAGEILEAWLVGTGLEELNDPAAPFRAVTGDAVRALAAQSFQPDARAEGVIRGGPAD